MKKTVKKKQIRHQIRTDYLGKVYGKGFLELVPKTARKLRAILRKHPFDAIAFTGSSGAALAYPMSYFLKLPLIHVRKGNSHYYGGKIEGTISSKRYLIIDDFIDSGRTMKRVIKTIGKALPKAKVVAICLYSSSRENDMLIDGENIPVFTV
jgi:adenine/guanine phosphoribosyltransferase-like PRPP-binding protein